MSYFYTSKIGFMKNDTGVINLFDNGEEPLNDNNSKYSELLSKFVEPFEQRFPSDYTYEDILQFGMNAWNMALMESVSKKEDFDFSAQYAVMPEPEKTMLKQMLRSKKKNFLKHKLFIVEYFMSQNSKKEIVLNVVTQDEATFIDGMVASQEADLSNEDFEEGYINRSAIIVRPKPLFFDWLNGIYPESPVFKTDEPNTYLVGEEEEDVNEWLSKNYDEIFTNELFDWHTLESDWPQQRTLKLFKEWFQFEVSSMVYDFKPTPVRKGF